MKDILSILLFVNSIPFGTVSGSMLSYTGFDPTSIYIFLALHPPWVMLYLILSSILYLFMLGRVVYEDMHKM